MLSLRFDLTTEKIDDFFLSDPKLCYLGLCDDQLISLHYDKKFTINPGTVYAGLYDSNDKLVSIATWKYFTRNAVIFHGYLPSSMHGKGMYGHVQEAMEKFFIAETEVTKMIVVTPAQCKHISKLHKRYGYKFEGNITKSVVWRKKLQDALIFGKIIKE